MKIVGKMLVSAGLFLFILLNVSSVTYALGSFSSDGIFGVPVDNQYVTMRTFSEHTNEPRGLDLQVGYGTPTYAPFSGELQYYCRSAIINGQRETVSYGNYLVLTATIDGITYKYKLCHMSEFPDGYDAHTVIQEHGASDNARSWDQCKNKDRREDVIGGKHNVIEGEYLGDTGDCGYSSGNHAHIELYVDGTLVDPNNYFTNQFTAHSRYNGGSPTKTHLVDFLENYYVTGNTINIQWEESERATAYVIDVWKGSDHVFSKDVGNVTSYDVNCFGSNGRYGVAVTACNSLGRTDGDYSYTDVWYGLPTKTHLVDFSENYYVTGNTINIQWEESEGAAAYVIDVWKGSDHVFSKDVGNVTSYDVNCFGSNGRYGVAVTACNSLGRTDGDYSYTDVWYGLPTKTHLVNFPENYYVTGNTLNIQWEESEGAASYVIDVWKGSDHVFSKDVGNMTSYDVNCFGSDGRYGVAVTACNNLGRTDGDYSFTNIIYALEKWDFVLPSSLKEIEENAFCNCGFISVRIPDNTNIIKSEAFGNCKILSYVYIPNSVKEIASDAFLNCKNGMVIVGEKDSYAETFAQENDLSFARIVE